MPTSTSPAGPGRARGSRRARRPDPEPGEVELVGGEQPRVLGGLAPDQGAAGLHAALGDAAHEGGDPVGVELADGDVVVEEQRLGAGDDEVVDDHRDEVDPDRVEHPEPAGEVDLGADPVGAADEHRLAVAGEVEREQPPEPADPAEHLGATGPRDNVGEQLHAAVGGVEVDPGVGVGDLEAVDDVVTGLAAAVDELLAVDVDALDDGGLGRLLATGETTLRRVQGMQAKLAQTLTRRRAAAARAERPGDARAGDKAALAVRRQLCQELGITPSQAKQTTRLGRHLESLPVAGAALADGTLTPGHIGVIAEVTAHFTGDERDRFEAELVPWPARAGTRGGSATTPAPG
jgi:hypothetical protein